MLVATGLTLSPAGAVLAQPGVPIVAVPVYGSGGASDTYFSFSLTDGACAEVDRLRREPLNLRSRSPSENLFQIIGRPAGQAATPGEIFFTGIRSSDGSVRSAVYVETSIGYMAYFNDLGKGSKIGEVFTVTGRPFESIASTDGNFAFLVRDDSSGRTMGAYLYHATAGRGVYLEGLNKLATSPRTMATSPLPVLAGRVTAAAIHAGSEATASYLVADPATGELHFLDLTQGMPDQLAARKSPLNLYDALDRAGSHTSPRRFVAVPIQRNEDYTLHVLVVDAVSGGMVLVGTVAEAAQTLAPMTVNLNARLRGGGGERLFTAVPDVASGGRTIGVWIHDSQSGLLVYVSNPGDSAAAGAATVTVTR